MLSSLLKCGNSNENQIDNGSPTGQCSCLNATAYNFRIAYIIELLHLSKDKKSSALGCLSLCDAVFRCKPPCVVLCNFIHTATSWFTQDWYLASSFPLYQLVGVQAIVAGGLFYFCAHCRSAKSHDSLPVKPTGFFLLLGQIQSAWRTERNPCCCHQAGSNRWPRLSQTRTRLPWERNTCSCLDLFFDFQLAGSLLCASNQWYDFDGTRVPAFSIPERFCRHPAMPQWL